MQHGQGYDEAEAFALDLARRGSLYVSPYNDPQVIAGQATIGAELATQVPPGPLTVVCGVGGGGLCSGLGLWARTRPETEVVGVEAAASMAVSTAVRQGRVREIDVAPTLADGLEGNLEPGSITPSVIAAAGVRLLAVSEPDLAVAMRWSATRWGLVLEGAGAAPLAAVLAGRLKPRGRTVLVLSGRNVDAATLARTLV
ncbi:MAG: pyridoxal-phosphate dependent enzyme [Candidatus Dormibacteraceae bacterium]